MQDTPTSAESKKSLDSKSTKGEKKGKGKKTPPKCKRNLVKDGKSPAQEEISKTEKAEKKEETSRGKSWLYS